MDDPTATVAAKSAQPLTRSLTAHTFKFMSPASSFMTAAAATALAPIERTNERSRVPRIPPPPAKFFQSIQDTHRRGGGVAEEVRFGPSLD